MKKILISTNMYKGSEFGQILPYLKRFPGQVGVEVFPMFHEECFEKNLRDAMPLLKEVPVSFHGPYYQARRPMHCREHIIRQSIRQRRGL